MKHLPSSRSLVRLAVRLSSWVAAATLLGQTLHGALCLQEGFNYAAGVLGTNPPWTRPTNLITVVDGGLTYPNLANGTPSGGAAMAAQGSSPNAAVTCRSFDTAAAGQSAYWSFLIQFTNVGVSSYIAGLLPPSVILPNGSAFDPCDLYVTSDTGGYHLGVRAKNGAAMYAPALLALDTVYFAVLKYEFASGRASLFLNPSPGGSEPPSPDAYSTGLAVSSLDHLFLRVSGPAAGVYTMDNLRVGMAWSDVTPLGEIPPASRLVFTASPTSGTAGADLAPTVVQIQNDSGFSIPSNNVPVTLTLDTGSFAHGASTVLSDAYGRATFSGLAVATPGTRTLSASASGIGQGLAPVTSNPLVIGSTEITPEGEALSVFLDSLAVERYWDNGKRVNWLTGAPGESGTNITVGSASHCSAFAAAVATVLNVYLLRPPDASDLNLANAQAGWLATNPAAGWYPIPSPSDAQHIANLGSLVVASLKETNGSGHIAVLRPSTKSNSEILTNGPQECQSGIYNYNNIDVRTGFGQHEESLSRILFYGHPVTNPIVPVNPAFGASSWSNGVFRLPAVSVVGRRYTLQRSADLTSWTDCLAFTNSNQSAGFYRETPLSDPSAASNRFYRLLAR